MSIGAKISKLMKEKKISQQELAYKIDENQSKIHEIISGKTKKVDVMFLDKVCKVFDVGFDYFLNDDKTTNNIIEPTNCNIGLKKVVVNNNFPEGIIENMLKRIEILEEKLDKMGGV
jgi:transcriptional regulator with XRE-family HTH domain